DFRLMIFVNSDVTAATGLCGPALPVNTPSALVPVYRSAAFLWAFNPAGTGQTYLWGAKSLIIDTNIWTAGNLYFDVYDINPVLSLESIHPYSSNNISLTGFGWATTDSDIFVTETATGGGITTPASFPANKPTMFTGGPPPPLPTTRLLQLTLNTPPPN